MDVEPSAAVEAEDHGAQGKRAVRFGAGVAGDGAVAVTLEGVEHRALGDRVPGGFGVTQLGGQCSNVIVGDAALEGNDAGPDRRAHHVEREDFGDAIGEADATQSRHSQDHGVALALIKVRHASVDIAAQGFHGQVREAQADLRGAAHTAGSDHRSGGEFDKRLVGAGDDGVVTVLPCEIGGESDSWGGGTSPGISFRQCTVRSISSSSRARSISRMKAPLPPSLDRSPPPLVPAGGDLDQFRGHLGVQCAEGGGDLLGLVHGHRARAGTDSDQAGHAGTFWGLASDAQD